MAYYLDLFSPETYEAFSKSDQTVTGFRPRQSNAASKIKKGDFMICYMTGLSRWIGILEVLGDFFEDSSPRFYSEDDPFSIRFKVKPVVWLRKEHAIPIHDRQVWQTLSFTKEWDPKTSSWTGKLRASLAKLDDEDGRFLFKQLTQQSTAPVSYPVESDLYQSLLTQRIRRQDRSVTVTVPKEIQPDEATPKTHDQRESHEVQGLLAKIGIEMGFKIWIPKSDRGAVTGHVKQSKEALLDRLPLNYDETTLRTIEQIDVIWLKGRAIVRAFEVEHTTSVYSGILRMADLLALQPNMDIQLHIVAPPARREKVFQEIRRPVFSLLEKGPLSSYCTFLSYDSVRELASTKHLAHMTDSVIDEFEEEPPE